MVIRHQFYILILLGGIACAMTYAYSENGGFRQSLRDFIERNSGARVDQPAVREAPAKESTFSHIPLIPDASSGPVGMPYRKGDWSSIIISPRYGFLDIKKRETTELYRDDDMSFISYGSMKLNLLYGRSMFTSSKYRTSDISKPVSGVITPGFTPQQEIQLHMEGSIGDRMTVYIDHDSKSEDNHYLMTYRALKENEPVREINAGEIDIKFNKSKYAVYDNNTSKGLGVDMIVRKNSLQVKAFGSVTRGEAVVETFKGNSSANSVKLADNQYAARTYYQLEPYNRYAGAGNIPA
jgi:hypothetical protein